jgi:molybdopterin-biosynthesis enzyme MoeA-like protein
MQSSFAKWMEEKRTKKSDKKKEIEREIGNKDSVMYNGNRGQAHLIPHTAVMNMDILACDIEAICVERLHVY